MEIKLCLRFVNLAVLLTLLAAASSNSQGNKSESLSLGGRIRRQSLAEYHSGGLHEKEDVRIRRQAEAAFQEEKLQEDGLRLKRQDSPRSTTTPRPKRRPSNIFSLFSTLLAETRDDARRAFAEISNLFNSQFSANTPKPPPTSGTIMSTTTKESTSEVDGASGDVTTTTEPYRISRDEFNGILNSNIRGIVSLFRKELSNAITDSGKNVREFGKELRTQIRPYVEVRNRRLS